MAHHVVVTGAAANGGQRNARLAALACAAALLTLVVALAVNGDGKDEVGGGEGGTFCSSGRRATIRPRLA